MTSFLMVPVNANGVVIDPHIASIVENAMAPEMGVNEIIIYSHGWSTDADAAMALYNRFSIEFTRWLINNGKDAGLRQPDGLLSIGIHWPSEIVEGVSAAVRPLERLLEGVQALTFYTMEKRADAVGTYGVYALLRQIIQSRGSRPDRPLRITFIGHSFGCKVVTSAVEMLYANLKDPKNPLEIPEGGLILKLVLIQAAFENTCLEPEQVYGEVGYLPLRMLVTTSQRDTALTQAFPLAHSHVDFFNKKREEIEALGAKGPTPGTRQMFGGSDDLSIVPNFPLDQSLLARKRLVVADLTRLHDAHPENSSWGGHHGDFNLPEIYALVAGFLFNPSETLSVSATTRPVLRSGTPQHVGSLG